MPLRLLLKTVLLCAGVAVATTGAAQEYPAKPVRLIDPFPPGAITNAVSRIVAQKFQEQTKQPMIVENRPGGGTNIGSAMVVAAPPDGYTLLLGTSSLAINPALYRRMAFDPVKELTSIALLVRTPNVLAVSPTLPARNVKELIEYARARPGQLNYGSSGQGATNHIAMELFKSMAKVDIVHVPFKGGAEALSNLLGGQTQLMFSPMSTVGPHDKTGRLRIIAVGGEQRIEGLNLPTVAESGLPGFETSVWLGLFGPAGLPEPIVARLNAEMNRALRDKQVIDVLNTAGLIPATGTPADMRNVLVNDTARLGAVVRATGARVD